MVILTKPFGQTSNRLLQHIHHAHHQIRDEDWADAKIIYVIRDPRDVAISSRNAFRPKLFRMAKGQNRWVSAIKRRLNDAFERAFGETAIRAMVNRALLRGNDKVHMWLAISWREHVEPFLRDSRVLKVRYERLLEDPLAASQEILSFLGLQRSQDEIAAAIDRQSFDKARRNFMDQGQLDKALFLRQGKASQWAGRLSGREARQFKRHLGDLLEELYPSSS